MFSILGSILGRVLSRFYRTPVLLLTAISVLVLASASGFVLVYLQTSGLPGSPSPQKAFKGRPHPVFRALTGSSRESISVAETGNPRGPLVLFIHGTPGGWNDFAYVMADAGLAAKTRLVSVDRPGWGASKLAGIRTTLKGQVDPLRVVLQTYPENLPAIVVGHSYGGPVAALLASAESGSVRSLILVAGAIDPDREGPQWYQVMARSPAVRWILPDILVHADEEILPLQRELMKEQWLWSRLRMPVVILQGDADWLVDPGSTDFARRVLINAPLSVWRIPNQGHLIPWDRPDMIVRAIQEQLGKPVSVPSGRR